MIVGLLLLAITSGMAAPRVELNGRPIAFSAAPMQVSGRAMVPMRAIFEALGADVSWNGATRTVTATKGSTNVALAIGATQARVDGRTVALDAPAMFSHGATMVPLRFVSEALGAHVSWSGATQTVSITAAGAAPGGKVEMASCPVLGTTMPKDKMIPYTYKGKTYYFCCPPCVDAFKADPEKYIRHPAKPKPPSDEMGM